MLAIVGPTASGKSALAVEIAKRIDGTVINGDPFQAYSDIPIGTGQPNIKDQQGIPHLGFGELPLYQAINPASFGILARNWIAEAQASNRKPILVTGSGLYLRGIWDQLDEMPDVSEKIVKKMRRLCKQIGSPTLHSYLKVVDPARATQLHPNDGSRIQRAMALHIATGRPPSMFLNQPGLGSPTGWQVVLVMPNRESLRERIASRVKNMLELGWCNELQKLINAGLSQDICRLRPLGYDILQEYTDPDTAKEKIIQATQAYAKRQVTWFKNQLPEAQWFDPEKDFPEIDMVLKESISL
ncbi:MAG: tRNA (adenosine(37)-N6)-dimethylallyltransferase MiaA [Holophagaceae bacterium]|nr:tRNA (adenosine(37)-N6)-dimethylallyltransferase MiaA [Holophagaceae bacterium]